MTDPIEIRFEDAPATSDTCVVTANRPLALPAPLYFGSPEEARSNPLAIRLLETGLLDAVLLQDNTITLLKPVDGAKWEDVERAVRAILEDHIARIDESASARDRDMTPEEQDLALRVQEHLNTEINPMVSSHGGFIEVLAVKESTAYVNMSGGCQGCGMASVTLKQGVESSIFRRFPELTAVLDTTDHAAGANPYYAAAGH
ncbi:MAG: NifU family protein [Planctomycetes bacterium]|nr:NifU family protein [Planctomycetota bacterium]